MLGLSPLAFALSPFARPKFGERRNGESKIGESLAKVKKSRFFFPSECLQKRRNSESPTTYHCELFFPAFSHKKWAKYVLKNCNFPRLWRCGLWVNHEHTELWVRCTDTIILGRRKLETREHRKWKCFIMFRETFRDPRLPHNWHKFTSKIGSLSRLQIGDTESIPF